MSRQASDARRRRCTSSLPVLAIAIVAVLGMGGCSRPNGPPELFLESSAIELGVLDPGKHALSIAVENRGGTPLDFEKITTSCSCTVMDSPSNLSPGMKGLVQGTVSIIPGPGSAQVFIESNDPQKKHVIRLGWFGKSTPRLVPSSLEISQRIGETIIRDLEIAYPGGGPEEHLTFLGASDLPAEMTLQLVSDDPHAIRAIPGLGVSPNEAPSLIVGKTVLRLSCVATRTTAPATTCIVNVRHRNFDYKLPLTIAVRTHQGLIARPRALLFTSSRLDKLKEQKRSSIVRSDSKEGRRLEVVRKPFFLDVKLDSTQGSSLATLTARLSASPPTGLRDSDILLKSANGDEVVIPVYITCDE